MHRPRPPLLLFVLSVLALGLVWYAGGTPLVRAQTAPAPQRDDLQRSIRINSYNEVASSGPARGETIYFYKCWMCHNKYTIEANPDTAAPYIPDLFTRGTLMSGRPLTDASVAEVIKKGTPRMPAFVWSLTDADVADLLSYLRSPRCCWEGLTDPPANSWYRAETQPWPVQTGVSGGARSVVRTHLGGGDSPEGIKVQLIAPNGVRTTVYTDAQGRYEFPRMQAGNYTLRIATPLEFKPFRREVRIDGATTLDGIVLDRIYEIDLTRLSGPGYDAAGLPATRDVEWQLSDAELLWNLPGTAQDKETFRLACANGCHSYKQMLRPRFDERGWTLVLDRMMNYAQSPLINRRVAREGRPGGIANGGPEHLKILAKWLAKVRGPESVDAPYYAFPRARGPSTRVVVTEYELPYGMLVPHDLAGGDSQGNIWFTPHRSSKFGKLDPRTGVVTLYSTPPLEGNPKGIRALPGFHGVFVDQNRRDRVWVGESWRQRLIRVDANTSKIVNVLPGAPTGNFGIDPDGSLWNGPLKYDAETGKVVAKYDMKGLSTYDTVVSPDGNWVAYGSDPYGGNRAQLLDVRTGTMHFLDLGARRASPARGGFDRFGSAWFGGRMGSLLQVDTKTRTLKEHLVPNGPVTYMAFYEAMPDKNGEVWAGVLQGRGFVRYNPRTERWIEYTLPEPYGHNRRQWIDNSTTPVTVWYVDHNGYIVRIQPLE